jgi:4-amino-4-deoxy-L-arabinose transferase-like glycosyltransferase
MVVASSPLMLGMSRVALNDSMLNLFWGCSVWAFMDLVNKRTTGKLALLVVFLTFSLLIKEASVLLIFFMIVFSLCFARFYKVRVHVRDVAVLSIVPLVITAVVYLLVSGGPGHCMALLHAMYLTHFVDQANPYALKYSAGPWFRYFVDLLMISPVIFLIAAGYAGHLIIRRSRDWKHMCLLIYFASVYLPLSLLQHTKVVRYVINLEMVLAVFCVSGILELFKRHFQEDNLKGALWVLILVCTVSYNLFYDVFVHNGLLDPITFNLAQIQRFIP